MSSTSARLYTDELLDPISPELPAGSDLRWTPEWDRIREARRADDDLDTGKWEKRERKTSDWSLVQELCTDMLRQRSKDLQLALWLTEADISLRGFNGLYDGLRLTRELLVRYWDKGLYPLIEDGAEDRAGPFEWLNHKLVGSILRIPITVRNDQGQDFSLIDLKDAQRVGSEADWQTKDGETDSRKKKAYEQAIADGHISMEMFAAAVKASSRAEYERFAADFYTTHEEFKALEKVVDEKFGDVAPNLAACRTAFKEIHQAVSDALEQKRRAEAGPQPAVPAPLDPVAAESVAVPAAKAQSAPAVATLTPLTGAPELRGSWSQAEQLIRSGQTDNGLLEMTRLAAAETSGRDRFQRKLLLAEACLAGKRDRLARSILEELAEQIDRLQLEAWESSQLISNVWARLCRLYKQSADSSDHARAAKLYERLCRLDPWQALGCNE
jgi:type VI secretion system protein ImpA